MERDSAAAYGQIGLAAGGRSIAMSSAPIPIVLLPGLHGTVDLFTDFIQQSPERFAPRVIEYPTNQILDYYELANFVKCRLPNDQPYVLLGESFSGPVAVLVAAAQPHGLTALVLAASFVTSPRSRWFRLLPWRWLFHMRPPDKLISWFLVGDARDGRLLREVRSVAQEIDSHVLASRVRGLLVANVEEQLRKCRVPILYLRASHDRLVTTQSSDLIKIIHPSTVIAEVQSHHFLLQSKPKDCWKHIERFVEPLFDINFEVQQ